MKCFQDTGCKSGRNLGDTVKDTDSIFRGKMDVHHQEENMEEDQG